MHKYKTIKINDLEGVRILAINRPEAMNALNSEVFIELKSILEELNSGTKALIITGEGRAFVAGADISEMVNMSSKEGEVFSRFGQDVFSMLENLEIPVIAAVNGFALGGGCELAMACDIRIISTKAKFGQPEVNLGLIPGYAGSQRMPRLIGMGNALYYLMTGDQINADEAKRIGLAQIVVEPEQLIDKAIELAQKISSKGPSAVGKVKKVARKGFDLSLEQGSKMETTEFGSLFGNEGAEGMRAFLEKRKPEWN
ncbi:MAG: enoyl-CoA hydratase-related protein [Bacteroidales bacterium]|nr:enoyl-CoA hydratase-related protein [Bacteroidales bacterium]